MLERRQISRNRETRPSSARNASLIEPERQKADVLTEARLTRLIPGELHQGKDHDGETTAGCGFPVQLR